MTSTTNLIKRLRTAWSPYSLGIKNVLLIALILTGIQLPLQAQVPQYSRPSWYFGAAAGANINFYRGSTQNLNTTLLPYNTPVTFHYGTGVGLYVAPLVEFHRPNTFWGFMFQAGYDNRKGTFDQEHSPCNCPADLKANISYVTVEPSLRLAPGKANFYLFAGPRVAFNLKGTFTYKQGINPDIPTQEPIPEVSGDLSNINSTIISFQIGAGYDIPLSSQNHHTQFVLSPFISFQPYYGQEPRTIETWNVTTLRVGAALKFGRGHKNTTPPPAAIIVAPAEAPVVVAPVPAPAAVVIADAKVTFTVNSPKNIPTERRVRETFPIRNYIFFDIGSTEISDRYVLITKAQVKDFREDRLEVFTPKRLPGRAARQMTVYYNVLNILGDRMGRYPSTVVRLAGASMEGEANGMKMAESVKQYLVDVFGINPSRIKTEGRIKPRIPSEQPGGTKELVLLREGDRRVSIWSESPELMMEYQTGPNTPLKPVEIVGIEQAPLDSYISFDVAGGKEPFTSWKLEITDENGKVQYFGPYTQENISIPGKAVLGTRPSGDFKIMMIGTTESGNTVKKETSVHVVLWTPPKNEEMMRFSIIYEINSSDAIAVYEKYLTEIVIPKIPKGAKVLIHGHSDIIGEEAFNQKLSLARANDVRGILEKGLKNAGRSDVTFEVYGFGEDLEFAPFENKYPEERFYNRTVIIDIIPQE